MCTPSSSTWSTGLNSQWNCLRHSFIVSSHSTSTNKEIFDAKRTRSNSPVALQLARQSVGHKCQLSEQAFVSRGLRRGVQSRSFVTLMAPLCACRDLFPHDLRRHVDLLCVNENVTLSYYLDADGDALVVRSSETFQWTTTTTSPA